MSFASSSASGFVGLTRIAIGEAVGTISCNNPSRFDPSRLLKTLTPVTLPPGRLRLSTRPALTGSSPVVKTIGIVDVAALAALVLDKLAPTRRAAAPAARCINCRRGSFIAGPLIRSPRRRFEAERLGGPEIDDQLEFSWLLDRNVRWFRPAQNLVDIIGTALE